MVAQGQQVADVVERVVDLRGREWPARPVGAGLALRQLVAEHAAHQLGIADLRGKASQRRRHLRVEHWHHQPDDRQQDLEILARGMQHLLRRGRGEGRGERAEVLQRDRVDADRPVGRGQLQQAELGAIGALAQELGVEADGVAAGELAAT